ncbi:MAG: ABC transporter permease [bacterium]|nr:ABC transporter permease [bacterium]MXZ31503.1 ABC transporter permease [Acidimicrobiia bacterium]MYB25139.1 ABC transporter permease [Acidimicrobiia bacterium]
MTARAAYRLPAHRRLTLALAAPVAALILSLAVASIALVLSGSNPFPAYGRMFSYGFELETLVDMVNRATPLYLSAVAVAIGFRMNLFNIGVEGQYILASIIAAQVAAELSLPAPLHLTVIILVGMATGSMWALIAGVLKVTRGIHEVISTIMLNAISISLVVAMLFRQWDVPDESLNQETAEIPPSGRMPNLNGFVELFTREISKGRVLWGFVIVAIIIGILYWLYVARTRPGYDLRASGINPLAAEASGVSPKRTVIVAMALSGAVGGLVGLPEVLGRDYAYGLQFTQNLGFAGIAVALLGQNHPGGIAIGALVFGFLDSAAPILDVHGDAPQEIVEIMKGIIIFAAVITYVVVQRRRQDEEARAASLAMASSEADPPAEGATDAAAPDSRPAP